jgi:N-(2-amino-2-carboxyethyl)-L-glutamate synthase
MKYFSEIMDLVGNTPLIKTEKLFPKIKFNLFAKLEMFNPGGSLKDRPAVKIILDAIDSGLINKKTTIIESSSGNMAIGLAQICLIKGLSLICVVDPKITSTNLKILKAYGAKIELVDKPSTKTGEYLVSRLDRVKFLLKKIPNSFWTNQYANQSNCKAHEITMKEICQSLNNKIDYLFCATSTCGTIKGCFDYINKNRLKTKIIAVDAYGSVIFGGKLHHRLIPGHGASIRPKLYQKNMVQKVAYITDKECVDGCKLLLKNEAIFAGGSSGAVVMAVNKHLKEIESNKNVVMIFADRGERYLDTIYDEDWVKINLLDK